MPVSHGTFQPCAGMSVASVSSFSRSQPNNYYSTCRFHTAHRQAPCSGLTLPRRRNAVAYIWQGRLGIEPTQAVLETALPALEHSPLYPAFAYPPERVRVLSNARFNAGKSNSPSRSHALLTGHSARQVWACRNIAPVRCQLWDLVQTAGLEPATFSLLAKRSCLLSYVCICPAARWRTAGHRRFWAVGAPAASIVSAG